MQNHVIGGLVLAAILGLIAFAMLAIPTPANAPVSEEPLDVPQRTMLTGIFGCLPKIGDGPHTDECAIGIATDDGRHYAIDFGDDMRAAQYYAPGARVTVSGTVVIKAALSSSHWQTYDMEGVMRVVEVLDVTAPQEGSAGKLDIRVVCESALMYMTFPDGAAADAFVASCVEGAHPEVIERYKADMGIGDGATI